MSNSRVRDVAKDDARSWSRRRVLTTGAQVASALALSRLWLSKASAATATTFDYYISTSGNDSNPGTLAQPWAITSFELASPNQAKMGGKRIGIVAGNYSLAGLTTYPSFANALVNIPGGSSGSPTYVASSDTSGNYSPRAATLTWTGADLQCGIVGNNTNISNYMYITIDGLVINGGPLTGSGSNQNGHILQIYCQYTISASNSANGSGIVIQNCEIHGISQVQNGQNLGGIFLAGTVGAIIQNNYIHDINVAAGGNSGAAGHCGACTEIGCYGNQYLNNTIANCSQSHGVWFKEGSSSGTVAYNYFYNCATGNNGNSYCAAVGGGGDGNFGGSGQLFSVHHNVMDGCGRERASGNFPQEFDANQAFYNNTVYSTGTTVGDWGCSMYTQTDNASMCNASAKFYNNIYYSVANGGGDGGVQRAGRVNLNPGSAHGGTAAGGTNGCGFTTVNNNCYYSQNGNYGTFWGLGNTYYATLASWRAATQAIVAGTESNSVVANPGFSAITSGSGAAQFKPTAAAVLSTGQGGGNMGAWDGTVTQIGCNFALNGGGGAPQAVPNAPTLTVS